MQILGCHSVSLRAGAIWLSGVPAAFDSEARSGDAAGSVVKPLLAELARGIGDRGHR